MERVGGIITFKVDGEVVKAKGEFTVNEGSNKRDAVIGADAVHGYKSEVQVAFAEGAITDAIGFDVAAFKNLTETDIEITLANGKLFYLPSAWYANEGNYTTSEGELSFRFEAARGEFVA